jgi:hypothetical protein
MNNNMRKVSMILVILGIVGAMSAMVVMAGSPIANVGGAISVTTSPVNGNIIVDGVYKGSGTWIGSADRGTHIVSFGGVSGYTTPASQTITVGIRHTTSVTGVYVANTGTIAIFTSPVFANVFVDGIVVSSETQLGGVRWWTKTASIGSHTVSFGSMPGYITPSSQVVTVSTGRTTSVAGTYVETQPILQINIPSARYVSQQLPISITNKVNGNAIVGADVKICVSGTTNCLTLKTDTHGITGITPLNTNYQVWASAPGYQSAYTTFTVADPLPQYSVKAVVNSGKVYVQVLNENNKPVVGATVSEGNCWPFTYYYSFVTNANGLAGIRDVNPGSYSVKLTVPGIGVRIYSVTIPIYEVTK